MRNTIFSNVLKTPLPPPVSPALVINKRVRQSFSINDQAKAHFTPIIELKSILDSDEQPTKTTESIRKVTKIISTNTLQKDSPCINTIVRLKSFK